MKCDKKGLKSSPKSVTYYLQGQKVTNRDFGALDVVPLIEFIGNVVIKLAMNPHFCRNFLEVCKSFFLKNFLFHF